MKGRSRWRLIKEVATVIIPLFFAAIPVGAEEWHPSGPSKDTKDWVLLKSGEWLRGNMDLFRDLKMDFDSDELDDLSIDWEDIKGFRLPREMTFVFEGQRIYSGSASMRDGVIRINIENGTVDLPSEELLSIIEGDPRERNFWSMNLNFGYTQRKGNTNQTDITTRLFIKREGTRSRLTVDLRQDFSEVQGDETANNQKNETKVDLFISRKFYITAIGYEYYSDKFQNIDSRNTAGAGIGYFFFRQSRIDWSIGLGGAYQGTNFISVEAGEDSVDKTGSVIPSMDLDWDITKDIKWDLSFSSRLNVSNLKNSTHHAASNLSIDIYRDIFELTFSFTWDRVDNPKPFEDGTIPEKDDIKMVFGFGIDL